jgi:8-amino-7-oxononanoate synthase
VTLKRNAELTCGRGAAESASVPDRLAAQPTGRRDPFAPLLENSLAALLRQHADEGAATHAVPTGGAPQPVTLYDDGRRRINLGTSNYLGLAGDPRVVEAAVAALRQYGTSTSGSRVLNGTTRLHLALEEELADLYGTEAAVLTSSGINANLALLSTVGNPGDALLVDAHAHASVHAGAAASRGTVSRFRHNSLDSLAQRLEALDPRAGAVVVVDGVYSMTGETAPLAGSPTSATATKPAWSSTRRTVWACSVRADAARPSRPASWTGSTASRSR